MTTLDNDIKKSEHYSKVNKPDRCCPLIFVGTVIAFGRVSNLMSGVLQVLFPGRAHCFISCQLLVKDEHQVLVLFVFVALRPKSTTMVIAGRSVHLTTLFSWASLNKQLTSNRAHTLACN